MIEDEELEEIEILYRDAFADGEKCGEYHMYQKIREYYKDGVVNTRTILELLKTDFKLSE